MQETMRPRSAAGAGAIAADAASPSVSGPLETRELFVRVDIQERRRFVVERDLDDIERRVPSIDLALAARKEFAQPRVHRAAHQAEDRMRLLAGLRDCELGIRGN